MKWLKYTFRTVENEQDAEGNAVEREIFTVASVPADEQGRALAEKEAYDGVIEEYDDGQPEPVHEPTTDEILNALLGVE